MTQTVTAGGIIRHWCLLTMYCCLCATGSLHAQGKKTDSLFAVIASHHDDSNAIKAYAKLAEYYRFQQPDSAIYFANITIAKAGKKELQRFTASGYNSIGYAQYMKGDYTKAMDAFVQYHRVSKEINDITNMAFALNNQGNVYIELGNYPAAIEKHKEALALRQQNKDAYGIAASYNNLGFISKDLGDYEKAVSYFLFALREFEKLKDKPAIAICYTYLGIVYTRKKEYTAAVSSHEKALAIEQELHDNSNIAISYHSIADVYTEQKNYPPAIDYLNKALQLYVAINDNRNIALVYADIGNIYSEKGDYPNALLSYKKSIDLNNQIGNLRNAASVWTSAAAANIHLNHLKEAKAALDSSDAIIKKTNKREDIKSFYKTSADYYEASGDFKTALHFFTLYAGEKDSLLNKENVKAMADMQVKYETEKKEQQIVLQQAAITRRNIQLTAGAVLFLLSILLAVSYYSRYRLKQETRLQAEILRQQDISTRAVLEAEERERQRIAKDLHDGVGQMMSAAKMNLSSIEDEITFADDTQKLKFEKIVGLVDEGCKEVRSVSHNMMPNALLKSGLASAIQEFIDKIDNNIIKVTLHSEGLSERLDSNTETVLYRVIQECVNNVIKHAGANRLDMSLIRDKDGISATVEDNGKGFDATDTSKFTGLGLKNIQTRIEYLKGTVDFDSAPGRGTVVAIHVPLID